MRNFDEKTITAAVLGRLAGAKEPRTQQISAALVRHLHAFIREIEPSTTEWEAAIKFLTETGHMCSDTRQEFILLSDTLGASMLVDAINNRLPPAATPSTVLGPFYVPDAPSLPNGSDISGGLPGQRLFVSGVVRDLEGQPMAGVQIDTWHSDDDGFYDVQHLDEVGGLTLRGCFLTDADGTFTFWSIVPSFYPIPNDGPVGKMLEMQGRHPYRPAHVHFKIAAPGYRTLVTHVFIAGDRYLDSDVVFGVKDALIAPLIFVENGRGPDGQPIDGPHAVLRYNFTLAQA